MKSNTVSLVAEDLTSLGGPMGTEHTTVIFTRYFTDVGKAKAAAEKHYGAPINWKRREGAVTSGDLRWVMYTIDRIKVES
jgi:hypothetical protein